MRHNARTAPDAYERGTMARNIAVVIGSPRKGGNTWTLAESFIKGAEEAGHTVHVIDVGRAHIAGCLGCEYCFSHAGICVQKDDMTAHYGTLRQCDTIVYATPVYYFSFSAQIKAFMDRMYCGLADPFGLTACCLLTVFEDSDPSIAQPLIDTYRISANYTHMHDEGIVFVPGVYQKGDIEGNPALEEAYELGRGLSAEPRVRKERS